MSTGWLAWAEGDCHSSDNSSQEADGIEDSEDTHNGYLIGESKRAKFTSLLHTPFFVVVSGLAQDERSKYNYTQSRVKKRISIVVDLNLTSVLTHWRNG